jgi:hypothetical protein
MGGTTPASYVSNISGQVDGLKNALMSSAKNLGSIASGLSNPGLGGMAITSNAIRPDSDFSLSELAPIVSAAAPEFAEGGAVNNVYKRPMFMQQGGAATPRLPTPMANMPMARAPSGAMPPMRPSSAPMAPAPRIPAAPPRPAAPDSQGIASMVADKAKADLATAQGPEQLINAFRGNQKPIAARYQELAEYVGPNDAGRTPTSVLTMVQPTIMMTEKGAADSGIGQLMAGMPEANAPMQGNMGAGIMRQAPVKMQNGGDPRMQDFQNQQAFLQEALGLDADDLRRRARSRGIVQAGLEGLTRQPRLGESAAQQILPTIFEALGAGSEADMAVDQLMRQSVSTPAAQYALNQEQARKAAAAAALVRQQELKDEMALEAYKKSMETPDPNFRQFISSETGRPVSELIDVSTPAGLEKIQSLQMGFGDTAILKKAEDVTSSMADAEAPNLAYIVTRGTQIPIEGAPVFDLNKPGDFARAKEYAESIKAIVVEGSQLQQTEGTGFEAKGPTDIVGATSALTFLNQLPKPFTELEGSDLQLAKSAANSLSFNLEEIAKPRYVMKQDQSGYDLLPGIIPEYVRNQVQTLIADGKLPADFTLPAQTSLPPRVNGAQVPGAVDDVPAATRDQTPALVPPSDSNTKRVGNVDVPKNLLQIAETADETLQQSLMLDPEIADVFGPTEAIKSVLGRVVTVPADVGQSLGIPGSKTLFQLSEGTPEELQLVSDLELLNTELMTFFLATRQGRAAGDERDEFRKRFPTIEGFNTYNDALSKYQSLLTTFSRNAAADTARLENLAGTARTTAEIQDLEKSLENNVRAGSTLQAIIQGMKVRQSSSDATAESLQAAERRVQGRDLVEGARRAAQGLD